MPGKNDIVMVSAVRTPFSRFDTAMADIPSIDLGVMVMKEVIKRVGVKPEDVDEINYGSCIPAEVALETDVPARQATLLAGFPAGNISLSLDRACCSSLTTLRLGILAIRAGEAVIVMSVGSENMPRTPHLAPGLRKGNRIGHIRLIDCLFELGYTAKGFNPVALDAGEMALEQGVTRQMQDAWALRSQELYAKAYAAGKFRIGEELMPVVIPQKRGNPIVIEKDESPRETTMEALAKLKPIYGSPTVTAGNAPPISAGASAILCMTRAEALKRGLQPLATVVTSVAMATEPRQIAQIPAYTIQKALGKSRSVDRRYGPDRNQRGLCRHAARFDENPCRRRRGQVEGAAGENERERRCHRHRPPRRCKRREDRDDPGLRASPQGRRLWGGFHLRGACAG